MLDLFPTFVWIVAGGFMLLALVPGLATDATLNRAVGLGGTAAGSDDAAPPRLDRTSGEKRGGVIAD